MKRIGHLLNTIQTSWSEDPAARGAAKMTAGAILVAEGAFGLVRAGGGRRRGVGGLIGGLLGTGLGLVFMLVGWALGPEDYPDEVSIQGEIVDVESFRDNDGKTKYRPVYAFDVDGRQYRFNASMRTSWRPEIGDPVEISYSAANPDKARRSDGFEAWGYLVFSGAGLLVFLSSLVSLLISVALIVVGIVLFRGGRADRKTAGQSSGFFSDLMSLAGKARSGDINVDKTAAGQPGRSQGEASTN